MAVMMPGSGWLAGASGFRDPLFSLFVMGAGFGALAGPGDEPVSRPS
ncbi:MAG: hypothetical protein WBA97_32610 [Actinophytocola sp.]